MVGISDDDVVLAVEFPVTVPLEDVEEEGIEPCNRVTLVEVACLEINEEDEVLATAMVV